jgi:hypothetical protein
MHPFVALMRTYCIDYTNSHDQSLYDKIMEPDYVVHISGFDLVRDESYGPAVTDLFQRAPGLGLVVHEFVLNGDRLCMRFSEHASMPTDDGRRLACWRGIGVYKWNGRRLTENYVEQDYLAMHEQLTTGAPHPLDPPHLDPWMATEVIDADRGAEETVRAWLLQGDLAAAPTVEIDDSLRPHVAVLDPADVVVNDLFSAGPRVPFHVTMRGPYRGGIADVPDEHKGTEVTLHVAGIADVGSDGAVDRVHAVTTRMAVRAQLTGASPI